MSQVELSSSTEPAQPTGLRGLVGEGGHASDGEFRVLGEFGGFRRRLHAPTGLVCHELITILRYLITRFIKQVPAVTFVVPNRFADSKAEAATLRVIFVCIHLHALSGG